MVYLGYLFYFLHRLWSGRGDQVHTLHTLANLMMDTLSALGTYSLYSQVPTGATAQARPGWRPPRPRIPIPDGTSLRYIRGRWGAYCRGGCRGRGSWQRPSPPPVEHSIRPIRCRENDEATSQTVSMSASPTTRPAQEQGAGLCLYDTTKCERARDGGQVRRPGLVLATTDGSANQPGKEANGSPLSRHMGCHQLGN